ncbi:PHB depolymerase family esterase [Phaeobacter sp. HF9A]|uniref:alpha/beta hydrolase family esterase n=1 Tax=Phaeobacter sp. HF9A TaxID=2721561 RepID=UPI0014300550|nr:alpha/beta fold hydrolase [Phaeobacter sp. HF9A]NIZ14836.1 prolyl oligopeptidase family serine peptidase [Phaeobacter sp. HF9A]
MTTVKLATALAALSATTGIAYAGCGAQEAACTLPDGSYEIILPADHDAPVPAVMFLHGHGGSAKGVMRMSTMIESLMARGYAVIAPNGTAQDDGPQGWNFMPGSAGRDDFAFLPEVLEDAATRFDIDPQHSVLAGFSSGAFMVNYLACAEPESFAAYLPVSGGFWRPQPEDCAGPVRLFQSHGWSDQVVPLEGRMFNGGRYIQGDIWAGLELWRDTNHCATHAPDKIWQQEDRMLRQWDCGSGAEITFELHPGGHMVPQGWADRVIDWLEAPATAAAQTD